MNSLTYRINANTTACGLSVKKLSSAILIKSVVVFASIRNSLLLSRWHDNLLLLCSKTVPLNGLAWLAGVWPATFSSINETDCSTTWRAKVNYALALMMKKISKIKQCAWLSTA